MFESLSPWEAAGAIKLVGGCCWGSCALVTVRNLAVEAAIEVATAVFALWFLWRLPVVDGTAIWVRSSIRSKLYEQEASASIDAKDLARSKNAVFSAKKLIYISFFWRKSLFLELATLWASNSKSSHCVTFSPTFAPKRLEVGASSIQAYIAGGIALLVTAIYTLFLKLPARYNLFYNGH